MKPFDYFKNAYLENYANFKGRARRSEYWYFQLFYTLIYLVFSFAPLFLTDVLGSAFSGILSGIGGLFALASLVPSLAISVRRIHDVGKSGWFILIPIYNFILTITEGDTGSNEYGPDPKSDTLEIEDNLIR